MTDFFSSNILTDTLKYIQNADENIDAIMNLVSVSNSTIANQISAVNTLLVAFTIVIGVLGVILGVYLSLLQRKVSKMKKEIEKKEVEIIGAEKRIEDIDNKIQSDISGLYKKLREEETMTLLKRLEEEPQDIVNLSEQLLARSIGNKGFPILKSAYMKLLETKKDPIDNKDFNNNNGRYMILFFQHYMSQALLDNDIREYLRKEFHNGCTCAFRRDIIKSTKGICEVLSRSDVPFEKESILVDYLKAINNSQFNNLIELKNIFQEEIKNKDLLVNAIEKCTSDGVHIKMFGDENPCVSAGNVKKQNSF